MHQNSICVHAADMLNQKAENMTSVLYVILDTFVVCDTLVMICAL